MKNYFKVALITLGLLSLFSCEDEKENRMPEAASLSAPENAAIDQETKPTLTWVKSIDPDNDIVTYDVYVSETEEFVEEDLAGENIEQNTYILTTALKSHTKYFWKVIASDDNGASVESEVRYFTTMNSAPAISGLEFPANEAIDVEKSISLKWTAEDLDGDALKYNVYLSKENAFTDDNIVATDISESEFAVALDAHTQYFWKIVATDTEGANIESDVASFTTMNTLPNKAELISPIDGFDQVTLSTKIVWAAATDADGDAVSYTVFYGTNEEINENYPYKKDFAETEVTLSNLRGNATYYWKVLAIDSEGGKTSSDVFSFSTINTVPTAPVLNTKITELIVDDKLNVVIDWSASIDPDKVKNAEGNLVYEPLVYDIYLSTDATIDEADLKQKDVAELSFIAEGLEFETTYFAKVITRDPQSAKAESNVLEFTTKVKPNVIEGTWTDTRDGKEYKTITIKGQTWLAENLAYVPYAINADDVNKVCSVYALDVTETTTVDDLKAHENFAKYGVLYNAYALEDIAPQGWHVATDADWKKISIEAGMSQAEADENGSQYDYAAKFLDPAANWFDGTEATNDFLFNAIPSGYYSKGRFWFQPPFSYMGERMSAYFWTNTKDVESDLYYYRAFIGANNSIERKSNKQLVERMSVRLVKD
ncbi:FISUMP domain-containing protein [Ancylomarina sp.]|uniref:FISUMP domain-containing protein n=1 Tax=Ancylomarina sp. TaxID=1970196 RepID=UPI003569AE68